MKHDPLTNSVKYMGYEPHKNQEMCKCGHEYWRHFNMKTKKPWGCLFSYNCDCEGFDSIVKKGRTDGN